VLHSIELGVPILHRLVIDEVPEESESTETLLRSLEELLDDLYRDRKLCMNDN